jgi:transcriptional regulator with XRE-family HTH domain
MENNDEALGPLIGQRVRDLRESRHMTQSKLSKESKIPQATLSRIENGGFQDLKGGTLVKLAKALRVSTDFLLGRIQEESPRLFIGADLGARTLLKIYNGLNEDSKRMLEYFSEFLVTKEREGKSYGR